MRWFLLAAFLVAQPVSAVSAQDYPDPHRRVRHIIPWGAGGATDTAMRGFMQYFQKHLGIPVVTENIPGGLSAVGLIRLKTARPDEYTIGTLTYDVLTLSVQGLATVGWEDFDLVGTVTEHPSALIVAADAFDSLGAFQTAARSRRVKVGNVGSGGIWHQHASAMERALEVSVAHIPYEAGSGAQLTALLGGEVDANVASLPAALPYVRDGTLRVLAVMAAERDPLVPDVPTFVEKGYDIAYSSFRVLATPAGTPVAIRSELERALRAACRDDGFRAWADRAVIGAHFKDGAETKAYLEATATKVEKLMESVGAHTMNGSEACVRTLERLGVQVIFGLCGDTTLPLYEALHDIDHSMRHVLTRDERSASFMADAYARFSGRVGVCEGPSGGGATYIIPGVAEANGSSAPLVCLTSDIARADVGRGTLTELDQNGLFRPVTKATLLPPNASQLPRMLREAFRAATSGSLGVSPAAASRTLVRVAPGPRRPRLRTVGGRRRLLCASRRGARRRSHG